jgi:hypothetical protein
MTATAEKKLEAQKQATITPGIHIVLQAKGGVGKSYIASLLAQYLGQQRPVRCYDTDPGNNTFARIKTLGATSIDGLVDNSGVINQAQFDPIVQQLATDKDTAWVIDTGAATFLPLWSYVQENQILSLLESMGRPVFIHCPVVGGEALADTLNGLRSISRTVSSRCLVVWLNEYFGEVIHDGKHFEDFAIVQELLPKVVGWVLLPERTKNTFGEDLKKMQVQHLTFREAIESPMFLLVSKQRLQIVLRDAFEQLDKLGL